MLGVNVYMEGNHDMKMKNKTKESISLAQRRGEEKTKIKCIGTAKLQWRELTPMIGSIPKRQIKEAP